MSRTGQSESLFAESLLVKAAAAALTSVKNGMLKHL
jgi:hypothetical protein